MRDGLHVKGAAFGIRRSRGKHTNRMSACPSCGSVAKPNDKFCNTCGTPVTRQSASAQPAYAAAPAPQYGAPPAAAAPQPQPGFGAPQPGYGAPPQQFGSPQMARCQMGHEIAQGASYCAHGHPIALDAMQFASDAYGGGQPAPQQPQQGQGQQGQQGQPAQGQAMPPYGGTPPHQGYGGPMPPTGVMSGYDAPPQAYGQPQPPQQGYGPPQPQPAYAPAPPPASPQFGAAPQTMQPPNLYGAPQPGFGAPQAFDPQQQQPGFAPSAAAAAAPADRGSAMVLPANALRGFLVTYQSNTKGDYWPLYGGRLTVGRASSGDQVDIPLADATISSRHAAMIVDGVAGAVHVEDTGSTNGTFVNEEHLGFNGRRELRDGDRIRFGGFTSIVKLIGRI